MRISVAICDDLEEERLQMACLLYTSAGYTPFACRVIPLSGEEELTAVFNEQSRYCFDLYDSALFNAVIYTLQMCIRDSPYPACATDRPHTRRKICSMA